ncbi:MULTISPECIES: hypothetical protein [unclassified Bradyrhizobium]|uniref:hypothetical protein n=1 Tax=unclassified Bradyrhizobium TaxID=2631580 RepID=UPI002013B1B1|nr:MULTISPECIES: hypothetical protein [unclassified Bradyrhizobium]
MLQAEFGGVDQFGRGTSHRGSDLQLEGRSVGSNLPPVDAVPKILLRNAVSFADRSVMREKQFGIWRE